MSVTIQSARAEGSSILKASGLLEAGFETGLLLAHILGQDRTFLITHSETVLSEQQVVTFRALVARRAAGEPLQYLTGHQQFFKLDFEVTSDVLIPRPETESIVEAAMELFVDAPPGYFAEIGTGSGCIVISLLSEWPRAQAIAGDVSAAALRVAEKNASQHSVSHRLRLLESNLFSAFDPTLAFDLIVSNPPYVPTEDLKGLQREVQYEPRAALDGGADGLKVINRLILEAPKFLKPDGYLIFEIGQGQDQEVKHLIDTTVWELVEMRKDLQGIARTVVLQKKLANSD